MNYQILIYDGGLEGQKIDEVKSFSTKSIKLLQDGNPVLISGENLNITNFSKENRVISVVGKILSVSFLLKNESFVKKLLK